MPGTRRGTRARARARRTSFSRLVRRQARPGFFQKFSPRFRVQAACDSRAPTRSSCERVFARPTGPRLLALGESGLSLVLRRCGLSAFAMAQYGQAAYWEERYQKDPGTLSPQPSFRRCRCSHLIRRARTRPPLTRPAPAAPAAPRRPRPPCALARARAPRRALRLVPALRCDARAAARRRAAHGQRARGRLRQLAADERDVARRRVCAERVNGRAAGRSGADAGGANRRDARDARPGSTS